jgi:glutamate/tyrosine decarboxylase-like PLP-dependent enzyme
VRDFRRHAFAEAGRRSCVGFINELSTRPARSTGIPSGRVALAPFPYTPALRELGRDGLASLVNRSVDHCSRLVEGIGNLPGSEILWRPTVNQGLVRFLAQHKGATPEDHDARTDEVIARINRSGVAVFGGVTWSGRRAMRISVVNWRTTTADIDRTVSAVSRAIGDAAQETT